jgi:lysophospholipase L1-like esterase
MFRGTEVLALPEGAAVRTGAVRSRSVVTAVAVSALVCLLGGCYFATSAPPTGPAILVIGDSNVANGGPSFIETLGPTYTTTVDGVPGDTTQEYYGTVSWPQRVAALLAGHQVAAIVVQLGTNDAHTTAGAAAFAANLDAILAVVPPDTLVLWNNVRRPEIEDWTPENVQTVNDALAAATGRWPNLRVPDEAGHFDGHPEWIPPTALHFTSAGYDELARWTLDNVNASVTP